MGHEPLYWIVPGSVGLAALAVAVFANRGRKLDDHPICRRCGFDAFGRSGAIRCTECGADLSRRGALRIGTRQRRGKLLATEMLMLLSCLLWEGTYGWCRARGIRVIEHVPAWCVIQQAHSSRASLRDMALA